MGLTEEISQEKRNWNQNLATIAYFKNCLELKKAEPQKAVRKWAGEWETKFKT